MATKNLLSFADPAGVAVADTAKNAGTVVLRDTNGGTALGPVTADQLTPTQWTPLQHATVTANTTLDASAVVWPVDATSAAVTITLPAAAGAAGRAYEIIKIDAVAHNVVISDGTNTLATLTAQYAKTRVYCNGSIWF